MELEEIAFDFQLFAFHQQALFLDGEFSVHLLHFHGVALLLHLHVGLLGLHVGLSFESELLLAQAALGICYPLAQDHGAPGHRDLVDRAQVAMARALDRIRSAS